MNIIEAKNISYKIYGREKSVLSNINLQIKKGEFVIILGHNGSGKSSLIKLLSGYIKPSSGTILFNEKQLGAMPAIAHDIITITQRAEERLFSELTLNENVTLWENRFEKNSRKEFDEVIKTSNIYKKLLVHKDQKISNFSGGEKQSILLSLALSHPPKLLFLDEHTASLDPKAANEIMLMTDKVVKDYDITAIMVTHQLNDALQYGSRLIIMKEGEITKDIIKSGNLSKEELREMMD